MNQPFDALAADYDTLWTRTPRGEKQRRAVWEHIDAVFMTGSRILDLGCGTGVDAVHLMRRGIAVRAIDAAPAMVNVASARGVDAQCLAIEDLGCVHEVFDGALSNFGALNCVKDLAETARQLARLVRPDGSIALCLMSRLCWPEVIGGLASGDWRKAVRRWSGVSHWRGVEIYYPTRENVRAAFKPTFVLAHSRSLGGGDHWLSTWRRRG